MKNKFSVKLMSNDYINERVRFLSEESIINNVFIEQPVSVNKTRDWCDKINSAIDRKDFVFFNNDNLIGFAGLVNISKHDGRAEFYIFISSEYQGKGFGYFVTKWLLAFAQVECNLRKISLFVTEGNQHAISLYEKVGFKQEGVLIKHSWFRGRYVDRCIYSIFLTEDLVFEDVYLYFS